MSRIEVRGLRRTYGDLVAVDSPDLDVEEGEILGVLRPQRCREDHPCRVHRRPDPAHLRDRPVAGIDPFADRVAATRLIGIQLLQAGLQAKLTVREALDLFASFYDRPADGTATAVRLGLEEKLHTRYGQLSGGQKQGLAIALALVGRPRVALLDELTTGLDPASRRGVWELVEETRVAGTTIVLVSHLMEEAQRFCDRIALVDRGRRRGVVEAVEGVQQIRILIVDNHPVVRDGLRGMCDAVADFTVVGEASAGSLSSREIDVLALVARGRTNREIARQLFVSEATVKTRLGHVYDKLGVKDRAAAVATAYERGLLG